MADSLSDGTGPGRSGGTGAAPRRVARVRRRLLTWGRANFARFAWREESDPWLSLVAELLVQRTRAPQAERVFKAFRERFPTAGEFVAAGPEAAASITRTAGLHWRGPLLYEAARQVAARGGCPTESMPELLRLPGVGPYAAAAWLSLHRRKRAVIIDNNVARWLARFEGHRYDGETRRKRWVAELADLLTPARSFRAYNYAVLDFTMQICVPGKPRCGDCPIRSDCHFGNPSLRLMPL